MNPYPRRGPRAFKWEQERSYVAWRMNPKLNISPKWELPEKGRARRKRNEARQRVRADV